MKTAWAVLREDKRGLRWLVFFVLDYHDATVSFYFTSITVRIVITEHTAIPAHTAHRNSR